NMTNINYLENVRDTTGLEVTAMVAPRIQKGDLLSIRVFSASNGIEPRTDAPYNLADQSEGGGSAGFQVDATGNIEYPQLGVLKVEGLTREELAALIKSKLAGQLNQPSVIVRFLNYRITVLGEVRSPGSFTVPTDRVTILDALGLAGDITEFGRKNTVKVWRETNGQREIGTLDLTSKEMFNSPYFRLQQNDVVFVEQSDRKFKQQERQNVAQQVGIATTVLTAVALILNLIR
ncbi:MAG TPA: polysaccharide biosynthesis/export family protein, partial [Flavisolibacter sp.]|nr:polysaccharide biosynthesis/export family protein [Flavisolibacter sp.]